MGNNRTPTHLRVISGNAGHRPIPEGEPLPTGDPVMPKYLGKAAKTLWKEFIATAFWLTKSDSAVAAQWCCLEAEFRKSKGLMMAARISQLRALQSELGLNPAARARLGTPGGGKTPPQDPSGKYF